MEENTTVKIEAGSIVYVDNYEGEVIEVKGSKALVHYGGSALHFIQQWEELSKLKLKTT